MDNIKVSLVSGLMPGDCIYADCYINGFYYDVIKKNGIYETYLEGLHTDKRFTDEELQFIESELRRQYEERQ